MGRNGIKKQFWLKKEVADELEWKARKACLTETALIRMLITGYHPPAAPGDEFYESLNRLIEAADNLQRTAEFINDSDAADAYQEAAMELKELNLELQKRYLKAEREKIEWR